MQAQSAMTSRTQSNPDAQVDVEFAASASRAQSPTLPNSRRAANSSSDHRPNPLRSGRITSATGQSAPASASRRRPRKSGHTDPFEFPDRDHEVRAASRKKRSAPAPQPSRARQRQRVSKNGSRTVTEGGNGQQQGNASLHAAESPVSTSSPGAQVPRPRNVSFDNGDSDLEADSDNFQPGNDRRSRGERTSVPDERPTPVKTRTAFRLLGCVKGYQLTVG